MTDARPPSPRSDPGQPAGAATGAPGRSSGGVPDGGVPQGGLTGSEVARITGGRLERASDRVILGAAVDSRKVVPGNLFIALPGERTDGHAFLAQAIEAGAAGLLVSRPGPLAIAPGDVSVIRVGEPVHALHALATAWRRRFHPLTVGITGSIAKTSTKEAVADVLAARYRTLRSEGNENNEIGLPLTVLRLGERHEVLVLEMGMYVEGEIAELVRIGQPSIGVVTAVQPVHLSRIGSIDAIETEKGRLVEGLPADGTAVLNADDPRVARMAGRTIARSITYGFGARADVRADGVESAGEAGMTFNLASALGARRVAIRGLGRHAVQNALAAAAVGIAAGLSLDEIARGLATGSAAPHRGELLHVGGVTIVDDSYNAAPVSMLAALEVLAALPGRRVAVLGEMLELGDGHEAGHRAVGEAAGGVADLLVVVGDGARAIADGARRAGLRPDRILSAPDREAAREMLAPRLVGGDVVLVKASRGAGLDLLVAALRDDLRDDRRDDRREERRP